MRKSKIEKRLPEPQHSKEPKADGTSVRLAIAKPTVVRCFSLQEHRLDPLRNCRSNP